MTEYTVPVTIRLTLTAPDRREAINLAEYAAAVLWGEAERLHDDITTAEPMLGRLTPATETCTYCQAEITTFVLVSEPDELPRRVACVPVCPKPAVGAETNGEPR